METESARPSQDFVGTNNGDFGQETRPSYTCTFCKRGFSNAQALGGHMNVHRKDRARLQESIQETRITTQTTKGVNSNSVDQIEAQSSDDDDKGESVPMRLWNLKKDHGVNCKTPTLQLSLWMGSSSSTSDSSIKSNKVSSLSSSPTDVDLELRLGMDSDMSSRDHVIID